MSDPKPSDHWLARPSTIRLLWRIFVAVLVLLVVLEAGIAIKGYFTIDRWLGFGAGFGFLSCVAMVLVARALGLVVKRPENYYRGDRDDA